MSDITEEPTRKGRSNAILTYEKIEEIVLGIQKVDLKVDELSKDIGEIGRQHTDHEVRIRALELAFAGTSSNTGFAKTIWQAIWPTAACVIALLSYLK
ncbi:hypothetical protein ACQZ6C_10785 [Rhizobium rhizogenes]